MPGDAPNGPTTMNGAASGPLRRAVPVSFRSTFALEPFLQAVLSQQCFVRL